MNYRGKIFYDTMIQDLKSLKQQFLEYIEIERGRSLKTVRNYDAYLERFLLRYHAANYNKKALFLQGLC